nr:hypothetical protein RFYW14_04574 [Pseudorhizobium flavum]
MRGLAIVAVVTTHAANFGLSLDGWNYDFVLVLREMVNFAVPTFFLLAGYFANSRSLNDPVGFWRLRAFRILPTYLFWTAVYLLIFAPGDLIHPALAQHVLTGTGVFIGYYVVVLVQMTALTPMLNRIKSLRLHGVIMLVLIGAGLSFTYAAQATTTFGKFGTFPYSALPFFVWYPFYHFGFVVAKYDLPHRLQRIKINHLIAVALLALLSAVLEAFGLWYDKPSLASSQLKATSLLCSFVVAMLVLRLSSTSFSPPQALVTLGRSSFFIYLTHLLVLIAVEPLMRRVPLLTEVQALYIPVLVIVVLAAMWGAIRGITLANNRPVNRLLGIE